MPILPSYNSNRNIEANPAAPFRNEAEKPFQDTQKITGTLQDITQKWSDAHDVMQATEAKAKYEIATADIQVRAEADPNFKESDKYYKELEDAKKNSLQGISNKSVSNKLAMDFDYGNKLTAIKIDSSFKRKELDYNKVQVGANLDILQQKKLSSTTPAEAMQYDQQINDLMEAQVRSGTLSFAEADKMLKDSQVIGVKYEIYADQATQEKDSQVLKDLKNSKGKYSYLPPEDRLKLIEESQRRIFQNNQTYKRENEIAKDQRFNDIFAKANEGTLTLNDLDAEMAVSEEQGGIPKKQLLDIRKSLQTRIKSDLETVIENNDKAGEYLKFVDNFISDETDRQKGREAIVNAFKDNILSPKEASLLNKLKRETEGIESLKSREEFMGNNLVPFKNAINAVNDFFSGKKNFTESEKALAIKKLLSNSADGNDPTEISRQIIKETVINKNPNILNLSEEGQIVIDENGYLKIMNNKGEHKDVGSKPTKEK